MSQNTRSCVSVKGSEQENKSRKSFSQKVARAISHRVERIVQTAETNSVLMEVPQSSDWYKQQQDDFDWSFLSEAPRWRKPLFSPEAAAKLKQKLIK